MQQIKTNRISVTLLCVHLISIINENTLLYFLKHIKYSLREEIK